MAGSTMQLEDWLDDLCVRFIINLPEEDLSSVARICFQVEEAQWFYEDFIRPLDPALPSMSLRTFCLRIFQHCPLLAHFSVENHTKAFEEFLEYKTRVPVRGAIMLNQEMDSAVLVKGWKKGANWGFPGGKINKDEDDLDCAIREVYEETGLDLRRAGLVPEGRPKYIELPIKNHQVRLYVFRDVPMDTNFEPQTRKEISKIQWYNLSELPTFRRKGGQHDAPAATGANKFYMVAPFMVPLKKWVGSQKKIDEKRVVSGQSYLRPTLTIEETVTEDDTWAHMPDAPAQEPAINTLDGATRELQRLLKMQPPTQGVQPPPASVEDKGSALLSILQSKSSGPAMAMPSNLQNPHTPLELGAGEIPQPHNPHHQNNQNAMPMVAHQAPPPFPFPPNQNMGPWNPAQQQPRGGQPFPQGYQTINHQQYGNNQAALLHPQPLPPQVQRSVFNKSAFQDAAAAQGHQFAPGHNQRQPVQVPPQAQAIPHHPKPALNGQSMALLNAFKRDTTPSSGAQAAIPDGNPVAQTSHPGQAQPSSYGQQGAPQGMPSFHNAAPAFNQKSPTELAASSAEPAADQHRSALLGMFKKEAPDSIPNQPRAGQPGAPNMNSLASNDLLRQLQGQSQNSNGKPQQVGHPAPGNLNSGSRLLQDRLATQPRAAQSGMPPIPHQVPTSAQPVRILQRGQTLQQPSPGSQPSMPAMASPYAGQAQPQPGNVASPPTATSAPSPGSQNRRPGGGTDQKRQLLSLFGKPQGSPSGSEVAPDAPRGRLSSMASSSEERRGSQTPISPADQSFLLGYLQSVTNNASR